MRRILSIDGGGIKGVFAAAFLARIEEFLGKPVVEHFDLVAGTSTGGLIALSLGLGYDARSTVRKYEADAQKIFKSFGWFGQIRRIVTSKYSSEPLRRELTAHFESRTVGDSKVRLLIPTMDVSNHQVHIFKTSHDPSLFIDYKVPAVEVGLAAVAAPTYFPAYRTEDGAVMVDGAIWAHNPALLAVIEAIGLLGWAREEICVLSIGLPPEELGWRTRRTSKMGFYEAGLTASSLFTNAQQVSALVNARLLLSKDRVVRVEPSDHLEPVPLDSVRAIPQFRHLGELEAERQFATLHQKFFESLADPFVPCHRLHEKRSIASAAGD